MEGRKMKGKSKCRLMIFCVLLAGCGLFIVGGEMDFLQAQNVVGIWQCPQVPTPWGLADGETILKQDGTFSKTVRIGQMIIWDVGTYTVGNGYIHYKIQDHEPKIYKGKPMSWFKEETSFFQFTGPDCIVCGSSVDQLTVQCYRMR
jgi:hypothetical protein